MVAFPDPETGQVRRLFTNREVRTIEFQIDADEWDFYDALTRYVEDQSIKAQADESATGRAVSFTMAMLQRRFASSIYAVRRSLERMREKRQRILDDPEGYRRAQVERRLPDDFEDLPEDERQAVVEQLEEIVGTIDPGALRLEIAELDRLIVQAQAVERSETETKLVKLREVITEEGVFGDPKMKLLIFTEHKDTLDYLVAKLREWGLTVAQIHGGMHIGDRDTPGTRLCAEREFRDEAQVLVATEAAGEGINLQFCWFMINYDIPWNPVRLEQRMGCIHRYGQDHDCLVLNFVASNTREGRVLHKLLTRLNEIRSELGTDQVFDVVGEVFPANLLERMFRELYAKHVEYPDIEARIVRDIDANRFRAITESALEGLAKRELNLSVLVGKSAEAKERRLVPEVIEGFFVQAGPLVGIHPREVRSGSHVYRVGRVPRSLWSTGERLEPRYGRLGRDYRLVAFDKEILAQESTAEWVTPGHPLFEAVREDAQAQVQGDLSRGAVFYDLNRDAPCTIDVFSAAVRDGRGKELHRRLFAVETGCDGCRALRQSTVFLDLVPAPGGVIVPDAAASPPVGEVEQFLLEEALQPFADGVAAGRLHEVETVSRHVEISLGALLLRQNLKLAELVAQHQRGETAPLLAANLKQAEDRVEELTGRLERRRAELAQERHCLIGGVEHVGRALVLPHPERGSPAVAPMIRDETVERIAVDAVIAYEEARGWRVESVESENRGFDLISRRPHPEDPATSIAVRFIEVKGRAATGDVALTANEYQTAERLKGDYWLYVVFNCGTTPEVHTIQNPARLDWKPVLAIEHYRLAASGLEV